MPALTGSHTPVEDKDRWRTPAELFNGIKRRLGWDFGLDLAAESHNALCSVFISPETNSLATDWFEFADLCGVADKPAWLNPPFSNVQPWADHLVKQQLAQMCVITNAATDTGWWHTLANNASQVWLLKGRVSFVNNATGKKAKGNNMGQTVFVFDAIGKYDQHMITVNTKELMEWNT